MYSILIITKNRKNKKRTKRKDKLNNKKMWHFAITVLQRNAGNHSKEVIDKNNGAIISSLTCIIALTGNLLL